MQLVEKGIWHLVTVRSQKRSLFLKVLDKALKDSQLQELVLEIKTPKDSAYKDMVLLRLSNLKAASIHLQRLEYFQGIERRPLSREQVNRMLGVR
ncbi:chromosome segregation ATPase [Planktothrix sp. FACHB-1355]|uniref:Chromosome segregation ATPase n=1 Tax=Aerosakkonema funiforme FACHB-1375 TaxID=2949571 RepID=A0A926ZGX7_9CYAN|nr:chromosome segregation ATPase [Aerosakkonema funiforme FACHB-1375]MBD3557679.1 chromosome segregation ATPase [Planktothrix sp. FACHB-1355]